MSILSVPLARLTLGVLFLLALLNVSAAYIEVRASCDAECQVRHKDFWAKWDANVFNLTWYEDTLDQGYETVMRRMQSRDRLRSIEADIKKITAPTYPMTQAEHVKRLIGIDGTTMVVIGNHRVTNKYPAYGFPTYEVPYVNIIEWHPVFNKYQRLIETRNYYPAIMVSGYYCRSIPPTDMRPDPNPLPRYYEPYIPTTPTTSGAYANIASVPLYPAHCNSRCKRRATELVDDVLDALQSTDYDDYRSLFSRNAVICHPKTSLCEDRATGSTSLYDYFHGPGINAEFTARKAYYISEEEAVISGYITAKFAATGNVEMAVSNIYVRASGKKVDELVLSFDTTGFAYGAGFCASTDYHPDLYPGGPTNGSHIISELW